MESHLLQMRGLKQHKTISCIYRTIVASFTDAWIETHGLHCIEKWRESHLLQMRGLKQ